MPLHPPQISSQCYGIKLWSPWWDSCY